MAARVATSTAAAASPCMFGIKGRKISLVIAIEESG
jgi:hypothetical protein